MRLFWIGVLLSMSGGVFLVLHRPHSDKQLAPDFTLKDASGASFKLSDYRGKVVILDFWATWCGPCKFEIPWFKEFEQTYKDQGFAVVGVAMDDEGWEVVKPYIEANKINYRIGVGNDQIARDYGGLESLPTTLLLDRSGSIVSKHVGIISKDGFKNEITKLLEEPRAGLRTPPQWFAALFARPEF